jgi:hypothetical protein
MQRYRDLTNIDPRRISRLWSEALPSASVVDGSTWQPTAPTAKRIPPDATQPADYSIILASTLAAPIDPEGAPAGKIAVLPTMGELLVQLAPPAYWLIRVKEWAKPLMTSDDTRWPREVAGVLYFAAVAAGRLRCPHEHTSDLTDAKVRKGAEWALCLPWLDPALASLFKETLVKLSRCE